MLTPRCRGAAFNLVLYVYVCLSIYTFLIPYIYPPALYVTSQVPHHVFAELSVAYPSVQGQASYGKATAQGRKREDEEEGGKRER